MPPTTLVFYKEEDGAVPVIRWLAGLPGKAAAECLAYLARLESEGHELRRPIADLLRDGIHELRPSLAGVRLCAVLYFFHGANAVVISHGLTKEREVPKLEIERAIQRMRRFRSNPARHTFVPAKGE